MIDGLVSAAVLAMSAICLGRRQSLLFGAWTGVKKMKREVWELSAKVESMREIESGIGPTFKFMVSQQGCQEH